MALETKLLQKLSQSLLMTPQLQQAIKLLQLGRLEYKEAIEKELLENPVLEELRETERDERSTQPAESSVTDGEVREQREDTHASPPEETASSEPNEPTKVDWEDYLESFSDARGSAVPKGTVDYEDRPSLEATLTREENLCDYIISQLRHADINQGDEKIVLQVVGNLNNDGYLCSSYEEIAENCECAVDDVERVMDVIKHLDPPGVGARNLSECLLIQLEGLGLGEGLAAKIVQNHLDKLEKRKYDQIARSEQVAIEEVYKAVTAIQNLEPRPGRPFAEDSTRYIVPDVYVTKVGGEYVITLNEDGLPKLRVSPYYLQLLKSNDAENVPNKTYLNERLKAASWLIKSIHQRQNTIFRVAESIVKFQREFLDFGIHKLKPLVLRDVADDIGMHESTVSRVTTNKFVHTPQGVFELKFFFTTGIQTDNGEISSSAIKEKIKNLVAAEPNDNPISDQQIVEMLGKTNIDIARRTVAKYRESLGIPASSRRKKLF